jgi:hypothetical protein
MQGGRKGKMGWIGETRNNLFRTCSTQRDGHRPTQVGAEGLPQLGKGRALALISDGIPTPQGIALFLHTQYLMCIGFLPQQSLAHSKPIKFNDVYLLLF